MMRMIFMCGMLGLFLLGTPLPLTAMTAKPKAETKATRVAKPIRIGDKWAQDREAQLYVYWEQYGENLADSSQLLRVPYIDEKRSGIARSISPLTRKQMDDSVDFSVEMSADISGKIKDCSLRKGEYDQPAVPKASRFFCAFMIAKGYIHPPLDKAGKRIPISGHFGASYSSDTRSYRTVNLGADGKEIVDQREAAPIVPITLASMKVADIPPQAKGKTASLYMRIDRQGAVSECGFLSPTFVDVIDVQLCAKAMDAKFIPALDHLGNPSDGSYYLDLTF